jgi:DNA-binding response OmpR family regulator
MNVIVITRNPQIAALFPENFYRVGSREEALMAFIGRKWDLVISDFDMYGVVKEIKEKRNGFYVIFIIPGYCDLFFYRKALEVGDFCFQINEMEKFWIRYRYLERKIWKVRGDVFRYGDLAYHFHQKKLFKNGEEIRLTRGEYSVLEVLIKNRDRFVSKEEIMEETDIDSPASIKVIISKLRKLGFKIINRTRIGYKLIEKDEE